jgi:hypothetical protein
MTTVATPPITTARLLSRHEVAEGTMAFRFERPANGGFRRHRHALRRLVSSCFLQSFAEPNLYA